MQCTRCGREVRVGSSFCPQCGEAVRTQAETTVLPTPPSPFSRDAAAPTPATPQATPQPPPGPPPADAFRFQDAAPPAVPAHAPPTLAAVAAGLSSGVLGAVVAGAFGALHVLAAFVTALNDDDFSKGAFLLLGVLVMTVVGSATWLLWRRAREARLHGRPLDAVEALSLGGAALTSSYGLLLLLTAALSDEGQALQLVF